MSHFYYFPRPYPDELIGSLLARACRHLAISYKQMMRLMVGHPRSYLPFVMSADLTPIANAAGLDAEALLWEHTVFPYVTCFMSQEETDQFAASLLASKAIGNAALSQPGSPGELGHRFCPACFEEELQTYGEVYWHRLHNLPLVQFCPKHNIWLMQEQPPPGRSVPLRSSQVALPYLPCASQADVFIHAGLARAISITSEECLATRERKEPEEWSLEYREQSFAKGLMKQGGCTASVLLAKTFEDTFGESFLLQAKLSFQKKTPWFALMLHKKPCIPFITPKHVLVRVFLEMAQSTRPLALNDSFYPRPGRVPRDYQSLDDKYVKSISEAIRTLQGTNKRVTVTQMLTELGLWATYRHEYKKLPKTRALISDFRKTDNFERQIGGRSRLRNNLKP